MSESEKFTPPPVPENLLDKVIAYVAPDVAARRMRSRMVMAIASGFYGGYIGGRYGRNATMTWFTRPQTADADTLYDLPLLRARSRDLVRNTPLATGAVHTMLSNVIGGGLSLMCRPDVKMLKMTDKQAGDWIETTEREFKIFAESTECDITRTQNFYGLQLLAFRALLESGDSFALLPMIDSKTSTYATRIQIIEADRIESPRGAVGSVGLIGYDPSPTYAGGPSIAKPDIRGGVELDANGAPVAYHVWDKFPGDIFPVEGNTVRRIPAFAKSGRRNVVHVFERLRPGQSRGVPYLAPVIEPLKQLDRYTEAEVMAAVVSSMFTVFVKTEQGMGLSTTQSNNTPNFDKSQAVGMGSGSIVDLAAGESVEFANPMRPSASFDPFVTAVLRQIGVALDLPFEVLIKHFTASYSAARAALLSAWQTFRQRRDFMSTSFCHPVYASWMDEAVALGRISAPGYFDDPALMRAYQQADWIGDAPGAIDPLKEIQAADERIRVGVSDLTAETLAATGRQWTDVHRQQVKEKDARVKDGLELPVTAPPVPGGPPVGPGDPGQDKKVAPHGPGVPPLPAEPKPAFGASDEKKDLETGDADTERGDGDHEA